MEQSVVRLCGEGLLDVWYTGDGRDNTGVPEVIAKSSVGPAGAGDVCRKMVARIPTVFGRLVHMASLRDPASGRYSHQELSMLLGADEANRALRHSHHQIFSQWLVFNLADQKADLEEYLRARSLNGLPYREVIPPTARDVEKQLYLTDLETLLELMRCERGAAAWTRAQ